VAVGGLRTRVKSARLFGTGEKVSFAQEPFRVRFTGLPEKAPDELVSVIEVECESAPVQDTEWVRRERPRRSVGI
jgi:alpha-L-fucosidase